MNKKGISACKVPKKVLIVISTIFLLGMVTYNVFLKGFFGGEKSRIEFWAGNAVSGEQLSNVSVTFIQGRNNADGESFCQVDINTNDKILVELPYGEYTVKWSADGYYTGYQNVEVLEKEPFVRGWLIPVFEENAAYVLVEWETETDFDLCVYTEQTGRCIGKETTLEDAGSFSYGDNGGTKGYELVFLKDYDGNEYGIYVKGNQEQAENQTSDGRQGERQSVFILQAGFCTKRNRMMEREQHFGTVQISVMAG